MIQILKMNASFGNLQKQELTLHDGLNVFCLSNEAGKSTWSAFLLCMLYGVDTAERASKTNIPAKVRYQREHGAHADGTVSRVGSGFWREASGADGGQLRADAARRFAERLCPKRVSGTERAWRDAGCGA